MGKFAAFRKTRRAEVLAKYGAVCWLCDQPAPAVKLSMDLLYPEALGGTYELSNLRPAHPRCMQIRGGRPASEGRARIRQAAENPSPSSKILRRIEEITGRHWSARAIRRASLMCVIEHHYGAEGLQKWLRGEVAGPVQDVGVTPELLAAARQAWREREQAISPPAESTR